MWRALPTVLVTVGALLLAGWIAVRDMVHFRLGEGDLFLAQGSEVGLLWAIALGFTALLWK